MYFSRSMNVSLALAVVTLGAASLARAADTDNQPVADDDTGRLSEVLVTARKRGEETAQSIPTAITAIGSAQLDAMGVRDFTDFAYSVPGLTFNDQGAGQKRYIVRGVFSPGQEQVAVYYDEVPAPGIQSSTGDSGSPTPDLKLIDMDRIEVLKGPQGTTFGANSQTGVVRFITKKPNLTEVSGTVDANAEYMQHGDPGAGANGTFNLPLIQDVLGVRVTAYYDHLGGYIDNVRLGTTNINWARTEGGRALVRYKPTDG